MGDISKIEWCDSSWNPWHGCHKVSPGCRECYMFREKKHYGQDPNVVLRSKTTFNDPLKWKEPRRIFTCSWSDWLIEEADVWRDAAYDVIRNTPRHTYQILTKRIERANGRVPDPPLPNVWLGVSVEDRARMFRVDLLRETPAALRFLSIEPLLQSLGQLDLTGIDWVIAGGESGPFSRPAPPEWFREIRDQCVAASVPFFFKQWGEHTPNLIRMKDETIGNSTKPFIDVACGDGTHHRMFRVGKKSAGRVLDGQTWDEFPVSRSARVLAAADVSSERLPLRT